MNSVTIIGNEELRGTRILNQQNVLLDSSTLEVLLLRIWSKSTGGCCAKELFTRANFG